MALTPAERKRRSRANQRRRELRSTDAQDELKVFQKPFFEAFQREAGGFSDFMLAFDTAGLDAPDIADDSDPKSLTGEVEQIFIDANNVEESPYFGGGGSLARGELMIGCLIDAASVLAGVVNSYKQSEIKARIAEIEQSDLSAPETKRKALADIVRLQKMLDQLSKQVRWTFPQWKVTGE